MQSKHNERENRRSSEFQRQENIRRSRWIDNVVSALGGSSRLYEFDLVG